MAIYPQCRAKKRSCAAIADDGVSCVDLNDTRFKGGTCPFYKSREQRAKDEEAARERLASIPTGDMLAKYYNV